MAEQYPGCPYPLGALVEPDGVNFSVYSRNADRLELLLYDDVDDWRAFPGHQSGPPPAPDLPLLACVRPRPRSGTAVCLSGLRPLDPARGLRFDPTKVLLDPVRPGRRHPVRLSPQRRPAARARTTSMPSRAWLPTCRPTTGRATTHLRRPFAETVIYEMHVGGFTKHPSSGVDPDKRGTYAGLIEKIPYLQDLGITAVELLPVFQFDWQDAPPGLTNYWGYAPVSFFAPHCGYSYVPRPPGPAG